MDAIWNGEFRSYCPMKCLLGTKWMEFIGHQIGGDVIIPSRDNLGKVQKIPSHRNCPTYSRKKSQNGMNHRSVHTYSQGAPAKEQY